MNNKLLLQTKSIMYKIISCDCGVYLDDWDEFIVSVLVCDRCGRPWNNSRTECFFCGTNNFHVYKCTKCGKYVSLTNATGKCDSCGGKLIKACINPECISNTNNKLASFLIEKGGVFEKSKAASMLNEMRCKMCGCKSSKYETKRFKIVDNFDHDCDGVDVIYLKKNKEFDFEVKYNGEIKKYGMIEEILQDYMHVNYDLD